MKVHILSYYPVRNSTEKVTLGVFSSPEKLKQAVEYAVTKGLDRDSLTWLNRDLDDIESSF